MRVAVALFLAVSNAISATLPHQDSPQPDAEVADADVITPIALSIIDPQETERLQRELRRTVVPIITFCPGLAESAEARFRADFQARRARFIALLEKSYGRRTLNRATINHSSFARFANGLSREHAAFPFTVDLAGAWALGDSGESVALLWAARVRRAMQSCICSEPIDETIRSAFDADTLLPRKSRVVSVESLDEPMTLKLVESKAVEGSIIEMRDLRRAREELVRSFPPAERTIGNYLASFLRPNALVDIGLTRAFREQQVSHAIGQRHFRAGAVVVRKGSFIDEVTRAAIAQVEEYEQAEQRKFAMAAARRELVNDIARDAWQRIRFVAASAWSIVEKSPWTLALTSGAGIALVMLLRRRTQLSTSSAVAPATSYTVVINPDRQETVFLPVRSSSETIVVEPKPDSSTLERQAIAGWQEQVLEAERRAEELMAKVRAGLAPELARHMMDNLVQELLAQRKALRATCAAAAEHVAALEQRFTRIHEELQDQLKIQEQRASALQQKLATKDLENSELLRAVLDAQKKLGRSE